MVGHLYIDTLENFLTQTSACVCLSIADLWEYYLPYLYSGISFFGVLLLLRRSPSCIRDRSTLSMLYHIVCVFVLLSVHTFWVVSHVQCNRPLVGQTTGEWHTWYSVRHHIAFICCCVLQLRVTVQMSIFRISNYFCFFFNMLCTLNHTAQWPFKRKVIIGIFGTILQYLRNSSLIHPAHALVWRVCLLNMYRGTGHQDQGWQSKDQCAFLFF